MKKLVKILTLFVFLALISQIVYAEEFVNVSGPDIPRGINFHNEIPIEPLEHKQPNDISWIAFILVVVSIAAIILLRKNKLKKRNLGALIILFFSLILIYSISYSNAASTLPGTICSGTINTACWKQINGGITINSQTTCDSSLCGHCDSDSKHTQRSCSTTCGNCNSYVYAKSHYSGITFFNIQNCSNIRGTITKGSYEIKDNWWYIWNFYTGNSNWTGGSRYYTDFETTYYNLTRDFYLENIIDGRSNVCYNRQHCITPKIISSDLRRTKINGTESLFTMWIDIGGNDVLISKILNDLRCGGPPNTEIKITDYFIPGKLNITSPVGLSSKTPSFILGANYGTDAMRFNITKSIYGVPTNILNQSYIEEGLTKVINEPTPSKGITFSWNSIEPYIKDEYKDADGLKHGIYTLSVESCGLYGGYVPKPDGFTYVPDGNAYYACEFPETHISQEFAISDGTKPDVWIEVDNSQKPRYFGGNTEWFNFSSKVVSVGCEDPTPGVRCKSYLMLSASNPGLCPKTMSAFNTQYKDGPSGTTVKDTVYACAGSADDYNETNSTKVRIRIDKIDPEITADSFVQPDTTFTVSATDPGTIGTTASGIKEILYCETDISNSCTPNIRLGDFCNSSTDIGLGTCDRSNSIPAGKMRIYKAVDMSGRFVRKIVTTGDIALDVTYDKNNTWTNTTPTITAVAVSEVNIDEIKACEGSDCDPMSDGDTLENLGYSCTETGREKNCTKTLSEQNKTLNFKATNINGWESSKSTVYVKIDETNPNLTLTCFVGSSTQNKCDDTDFVNLKMNASDSLSNGASSGINKTKYCIYESTEQACDVDASLYETYSSVDIITLRNQEQTAGVAINAGNTYTVRTKTFDNAGNSKIKEKNITILSTITGSINYQDEYTNKTSISITVNNDTHADYFLLYVRNATLSNGECGAYNMDSQVGGQYTTFASPITITDSDTALSSGYCYKFETVIYNNTQFSNRLTNTSEVKIDRETPAFNLIAEEHSSTASTIFYNMPNTIWSSDIFNVTWTNTTSDLSGFDNDAVVIENTSCDIDSGSCEPPTLFTSESNTGTKTKRPVENNKLYIFNFTGKDRAGNINKKELNVSVDTEPPSCEIRFGDPINSKTSVLAPFMVYLIGNDNESGIKEYIIDITKGSADISTLCNVSGSSGYFITPNNFSCLGIDGTFTFRCIAKDNVGHLSALKSKTVNITTNIDNAYFTSTLPKWINSSNINLEFGPDDSSNTFYIDYIERYGENGLWSPWTPSFQSAIATSPIIFIGDNGHSYYFNISLEKFGIKEDYICDLDNMTENGCANKIVSTTVDTEFPIYDLIYIGKTIKNVIIPDSENNFNLTVRASDAISGIKNISFNIGNGLHDCDVNTEPWKDDNTNCTIQFGTLIGSLRELFLDVNDRAGNINSTHYFVTAHPIAAAENNNIVMHIGESILLKVDIWELFGSSQNVTLDLSGYSLARFVHSDAPGFGALSNSNRTLNTILPENATKTVYIKIPSTESGEYTMNITANSSSPLLAGIIDTTKVRIKIQSPASFSGMETWTVILLILLSGIMFWKIDIKL